MVALSPSTAIGRAVENVAVPFRSVVPIVSVPLPSVRLLKMMPFAAWTLALILLRSIAAPEGTAAPSELSPAMIRLPARIDVPPV
jgi:hypothetical protein